ncbi:LOW QUALITY PROTEIN: AAA-ATPase At2g18190-like [Asparagus officinalis]|uniref:LOW QUALITY PROTEIN: AAA-ATPase At2g18190-like n=1 Tax=Asparagus officinalis TaxID=4686 RepID=UPI00098E04BD|nr:LOW QUALITY PROTEIN: AAA-ATPase At2g18190-like [Asparagus officinalis]
MRCAISYLQLMLSGLLYLADGLWSSCGDERIIMFTTNHKEKLDPALLQPGRNMGYCIFSGFRVLASNYHSINGHPLFGGIEGLSGEVKVTLAEVIGDDEGDDSEVALNGLIGFLKRKKIQGGR